MQFSVYINQSRALEWQLNLSQTVLFSFLYEAHAWATETIVNGAAYYWVSKDKICTELPLLSDKPDTIKRLMAALENADLIERMVLNNQTLVRITEKGKSWNNSAAKGGEKNPPLVENSHQGGEKNPLQVGKKIPSKGGKKSPQSYNHNHITSNQIDIAPEAQKSSRKKPALDFSPWTDLGPVDEQTITDLIQLRQQQRASLTQTVINAAAKEIIQLTGTMTVNEALQAWVFNGWRGFKAEWVLNRMRQQSTPWKSPPKGSPMAGGPGIIERLTDTDWAI